ncbi:hypothetical protein BpHYR1_007749 [Brachionus plicatilis]|uniref:Uncharacterized protein n=1 Tax=Brachionus plicatilis TaxID=10195 RepID=A0A3M7RNW3_BRAPC|nr:hypothetical protein BpHYR1_007749 [Brachionus plicatilis]
MNLLFRFSGYLRCHGNYVFPSIEPILLKTMSKMVEVRKPFSRIFKPLLVFFSNFNICVEKKSFCAECFEIVLNGYFFCVEKFVT